jgi:DNA-binding transcriptional LysR family regulator
MEVELRHLRYVVIAADSGSFRRAAVSLGIHESAVSRRVRDLEDEVGATLFIRHSGGIILTHAGTKFLRHARHVLETVTLAKLESCAAGRAETGSVRIGVFSSLASGFLPDLVRAFCASHESIKTSMTEGGRSEHIAAVRSFETDVAFVSGVPVLAGCVVEQLWTENVFVVLPLFHFMARPS